VKNQTGGVTYGLGVYLKDGFGLGGVGHVESQGTKSRVVEGKATWEKVFDHEGVDELAVELKGIEGGVGGRGTLAPLA
jgi:hypothetical protein